MAKRSGMLIIVASLFTAGVWLYFFRMKAVSSASPPVAAAAPIYATTASPRLEKRVALDSRAVTAQAAAEFRARPHVDYFHRILLGFPIVSEFYRPLIEKLPPGETSELLAIFVAEGPVRDGSPDFLRFMDTLHEDIRAHSDALAELLDSQNAVLKSDPFVYQMALNLVFQLSLPAERKAELLGNAMSIHFQKEGESGVTRMSANITNAFILMKNAGVTQAQAMPYIQKGVRTNQDDPVAASAFAARANAYYPGSL